MDKQESAYWYMIKGVCIIAVIIIHILSLKNWGDNRTEVYIRQVLNFPVAVFVFLAGYFVKTEEVKENWKRWVRKRGCRILIPYIIFSLLYIMISVVLYKNTVNIKGVLVSLLLGTSNVQMYFCIMLFQCIVITPLLVYAIEYQLGLLLSGMVTFICILISYANQLYKILPFSIGIFGGSWILFYFMGIYLRNKDDSFEEKIISWELGAFFVFATSWLILETEWMYRSDVFRSYSMSQVKIGNCLFVTCLILLLYKCSKDVKSINPRGILVSIGKVSFGIYLIHTFFLDVLEYYLPNTDFIPLFLITLISSYIISWVWRFCKIKAVRN